MLKVRKSMNSHSRTGMNPGVNKKLQPRCRAVAEMQGHNKKKMKRSKEERWNSVQMTQLGAQNYQATIDASFNTLSTNYDMIIKNLSIN